ncbi:MAG: diacylglycerol kinase [Treponema sp.]|nr:diacylglycerol kinase [Treponema sp.]
MIQKLEVFGSAIAGICSRSLVVPGKPLRWTVIANPKAGGFTINSRWKNHSRILAEALERAGKNPPRGDAAPSAAVLTAGENAGGTAFGAYGLVSTTGAGHAGEVVSALLNEAAGSGNKAVYLVITAGGDGTSLESLRVLFTAPESLRSRFIILRLPLGTGNDGADSPDLAKALDLLINPSQPEKTRGVQLSVSSTGRIWPDGKPLLAFNILSLGLDAFVTHMTNKMKGKLPGDSYKLWVDIAALLYDRLYKVGPLSVKGYDENGREVMNFTEKILLCAVGVSGHRTYGSMKKILPDERNVCAVKQMSLFRKLAIKGLFTTGGHASGPESIMGNAHRLEISGENPILAQMDGETVLLQKEDFPVVVELTAPVIKKLVPLP